MEYALYLYLEMVQYISYPESCITPDKDWQWGPHHTLKMVLASTNFRHLVLAWHESFFEGVRNED